MFIFILSSEPGYYEDGKFGIRLENIVMIKNASTTVNNYDNNMLFHILIINV